MSSPVQNQQILPCPVDFGPYNDCYKSEWKYPIDWVVMNREFSDDQMNKNSCLVIQASKSWQERSESARRLPFDLIFQVGDVPVVKVVELCLNTREFFYRKNDKETLSDMDFARLFDRIKSSVSTRPFVQFSTVESREEKKDNNL